MRGYDPCCEGGKKRDISPPRKSELAMKKRHGVETDEGAHS